MNNQVTSPPGMAAASGTLLPKWTDHKGARILGLSRSHLYELAGAGKIRSACIRRKGALRGRRLFNCGRSAPSWMPASNRRHRAPETIGKENER